MGRNRTPVRCDTAVHGTLMRRTLGREAESGLMSYAHIAAQLDAALANPQARTILLDVDSPGGESGGVFDLADRIRGAARIKPVWAGANDTAFSAAYALASAAERVFLSRTGGVGSIGVIAVHADQAGKDAQEGVRYTTVFAGVAQERLHPTRAPVGRGLRQPGGGGHPPRRSGPAGRSPGAACLRHREPVRVHRRGPCRASREHAKQVRSHA
jgi:hypothetical protein